MKQQKMSEPRILVRLLRMYCPWNWEFGSALSKFRNFGGFEPPNPPPPRVRHCLVSKRLLMPKSI
jgi:hypothetical protein